MIVRLAVVAAIAGSGVFGTSSTASAPVARNCPRVLAPGPRAPQHILAVVHSEVRHVPGFRDRRPFRVTSLSTMAHVWGNSGSSGFRGIAVHQCGERVANRSWIVFLYFPGVRSASLSEGLAYFARTPAGWRLWYRWR